jgi:hypothetical protein
MKRMILGLGVVGLLFTGSNVSASQYSDAVNALGPAGYWRLQDPNLTPAGRDEVGNAHPFTTIEAPIVHGDPGPSLPGMESNQLAWTMTYGQGAQTTDYIPATGLNPRTLVAWAKLAEPVPGGGVSLSVASYGTKTTAPNTGTAFQLFVAPGFNYDNGTAFGHDNFYLNILGRQVEGITTPFTSGVWHQVVAELPSGAATLGDAKLYVDGVLQELQGDKTFVPNTAPDPSGDVSFRIGRDFGGYGWNGSFS